MNKHIVIPTGSLLRLDLEDSPSLATLAYGPTDKHARDGHRVESSGNIYRHTNLATGAVSYSEEV